MSRCVFAPIILYLENQAERHIYLQTIPFDLWSNPLVVTSQENGWDHFKVHQRRVQWSVNYVCQKNEYRYLYNWIRAFPGGSDGKEICWDARDPGCILGLEDPLEKEMAIHSSILAWRLPWTEEPGRLQFMRSQRVGHDWATDTGCFQILAIIYETAINIGWPKSSFIFFLKNGSSGVH